MSHIFCFGFGYIASFLATKLIAMGWKVSGTSRSVSKFKPGLRLFNDEIADIPQQIFSDVTHVLVSIPPSGDRVYERYKNCFDKIRWLGYLSATSVYGDHAGNWVTEESATIPISRFGIERLRREQVWSSSGLPVHIFRLAAIYGPGRNALLDLIADKAINVDKQENLFSRVHAEDIASLLIKSINKPSSMSIYNVADDLPAAHSEVLEYAASLLNMTMPPKVDLSLVSETLRDFYRQSKKVSNAKIKKDLDMLFLYPTYKHGLNALFADL